MNGTDALAALADIELPPPPADGDAWMFTAVLIAAIVLAGATLLSRMRLRRRPSPSPGAAVAQPETPIASPLARRAEAARALRALQSDWQARRVSDREAGYRLCALLRRGLGLNGLDAAQPPAGIARPGDWTRAIASLQHVRYAGRDEPLPLDAFDLAQAWLEPPEGSGTVRSNGDA